MENLIDYNAVICCYYFYCFIHLTSKKSLLPNFENFRNTLLMFRKILAIGECLWVTYTVQFPIIDISWYVIKRKRKNLYFFKRFINKCNMYSPETDNSIMIFRDIRKINLNWNTCFRHIFIIKRLKIKKMLNIN